MRQGELTVCLDSDEAGRVNGVQKQDSRDVSELARATMEGSRGWSEIVIAAIALLLVPAALLLGRRRSSHKLPPGPKGWPVIGSLPSLGILPHRSLLKLSQQYGPLMCMRWGSVRVLVVSSPQMAKEILKTNDQAMASRPYMEAIAQLTFDVKDVIWAPYGQYWRDLRKLFTQELLSGARMNQFTGLRQEEGLASLHRAIDMSKQAKVVDVREMFTSLAFNNITQMMLKKRYFGFTEDCMTPELVKFQKLVADCFDVGQQFNIADYIPSLRLLDILRGNDKQAKDCRQRLDELFDPMIEEHRRKQSLSGTQDKSAQDFIDAMIAARLSKGQTESEECLSTTTMKALLIDMILAGAETGAVVSEWIMVELIRNPEIMKRVQDELDSVVGPNRLVTEADIAKLEYLQAVVKEGFRLHPPAPLLLPHESTHDCRVGGYHIPAGTRVFINTWAIQVDPTVWEKPLEFYPDRFLNSKLDTKGQDFELLPFGSGRRMCPGMNLGNVFVSYSLALLLHAATWELPEGESPQDIDVTESFVTVCRKKMPLLALAKPRLPAHVIYPS